MLANSAKLYDNVQLGESVIIEDFCIIGCPFAGYNGQPTIIGNGSVIRSHTVIYAGTQLGSHVNTGNKANIRELCTIGDDASIGTLSVIEHHVTIGQGVRIHSQSFIPEFTILKDGAWIGPNVVFTNARYPKHPQSKQMLSGVVVHQNAKVGANTTILPGVVIGENALVGAGSVVTKDVPSGTIVAGSPAHYLRDIHYGKQ